jgi:methionine-rich copper-binding protein CopC
VRPSLLAVVVAMLTLLATAVAHAHDEIVGTTPANGERVQSPPSEVRIQFSEEAEPRSGSGSITGPDGQRWESGTARLEGTTLVIPMEAAAGEGAYTVRFEVVSSDGHSVDGTIGFEITAETTRPAESSQGVPPWSGLMLAAAGVAGAVVITRVRRGRAGG